MDILSFAEPRKAASHCMNHWVDDAFHTDHKWSSFVFPVLIHLGEEENGLVLDSFELNVYDIASLIQSCK